MPRILCLTSVWFSFVNMRLCGLMRGDLIIVHFQIFWSSSLLIARVFVFVFVWLLNIIRKRRKQKSSELGPCEPRWTQGFTDEKLQTVSFFTFLALHSGFHWPPICWLLPESKMTSSNILSCFINCPTLKEIYFTIMYDNEKQVLSLDWRGYCFYLQEGSNALSIIKKVDRLIH